MKSKKSHILPSSDEQMTQIQLLQECPLCKTAYAEEHMAVLEEDEDAQLLHVTCSGCHQAIFAIVMSSRGSISSIGMVTDLNLKDAERSRVADPITEDTLFSFSQLLRKKPSQFIHNILQ